ncbi:DNA adenine methylase [Neorhodopirellula lusitana]|uniref:DNA adenine methylase n=1 Tax=Neorhodopirellula lusitana TaxID=445327 RepID=UPI00384EEDBC
MKWHGGKHYLAGPIVRALPKHSTYVEPFGGAASVLLNKPVSKVEVYNDLNESLTQLFTVIRDHGEEFHRRLSLSPYSEVEFERCQERSEDVVEQARRDYVRLRQSIGGRGDAFSATLHRVRRGMADVVSGYLSAIDEQLPLIVDRLRSVQILCQPAIKVITRWDSDETTFYCDPPYVPDTRTAPKVYDCEMTTFDHEQLLEVISGVEGNVVLSGYKNELYCDLLKNWKTIEIDIANHSASGKSKERRVEVLWIKERR